MNRLYFKLLAWFVIASTLAGAATLILIRPLWDMLDQQTGNLAAWGQQAVHSYEGGGAPALDAYLRRLREDQGLVAVLADRSGEALSQPRLRSFHRQLLMPGEYESLPRDHPARRRLLVIAVNGEQGRYQWRVVRQRLEPEQWRLLGWARLVIFLSVLAVTALLFAWWLGRPIQRLKTATRQMAGGDLTARVSPALARRKDALGNLGEEFNRMAEHLQQLVHSKQRLLRDVSHELRSPLARLDVALELLRDNPQNPRALQRIATESRRLGELIDQVMTLARLDDPEAGYTRERLNLATLVESTVEDLCVLPAAAISITRLDEVFVDGNAGLLRSAVENLLRNALHYTASGTPVEVTLIQQGSQASLQIRDQGPGLPGQELQAIFRPFYRTAEARDRDSGGYGVGLAIVQRVAQSHGGQVEARNCKGGSGLEVELRLPLAAASGDHRAESQPGPSSL